MKISNLCSLFVVLSLATGGPALLATRTLRTGQSFSMALPPAPDFPGGLSPGSYGERLEFSAISAGYSHTCGITPNGGVKCWGANYSGQLGNGSRSKDPIFIPLDVVGLGSAVKTIAAGENHTCALTITGGVKCWGANAYGELGDGTTQSSNTPVEVVGLDSGVKAITAGELQTCAVTEAGGVKCWGGNYYGQLGDGTTQDRSTPVDVTGLTSGVKGIAAGVIHTCALTTSGGVKCWGSNFDGQLGDGTRIDRSTPVDVTGLSSGVIAIDASDATLYTSASHTCALTSSGGVKCWGGNDSGQLGDGTSTQSSLPVDVIGLGSGAKAIATGGRHTCAVTANGGAKCWGSDFYGELGNGRAWSQGKPSDVIGLESGLISIQAGVIHTCALGENGAVKCWGDNSMGQLGDGESLFRSVPVEVSGLEAELQAIGTGSVHTCALTSAGGVSCWGRNNYGQLGDGTTIDHTTPARVYGLESGVQAITLGQWHTCALQNGRIKCWGRNESGQLGDGTTTDQSWTKEVDGIGSRVIGVAAGGYHTCALTETGGVKCWGEGYLGDGGTQGSLTPVDVVGLGSGVDAISAGTHHTCALISTGGVKCWGYNYLGQLGDGTTETRTTPVDVVGLKSGVKAISAGGFYTCAVMEAGGVKCWGSNNSGELGDGTKTDRDSPVDVIGLNSGVRAISTSSSSYTYSESCHTCALLNEGGVQCWGGNGAGQLGDGTRESSSTPVEVIGLASRARAISAGDGYTCALAGSGRAKCWGGDGSGQLGMGAIFESATPVEVAGAYLMAGYPNGGPGSIFTLTGWNFPADSAVSLSINGQAISATLNTNPTGSFLVFLDTGDLAPGTYTLVANGIPSNPASFVLGEHLPVRAQEGGGRMFLLPAGIHPDHFMYFLLISKLGHLR